MTKRPPYHHGDLRAELMKAAVHTIVEDGTDALTLRGLARRLGVSHAAPARHFPTRHDLLCALALEGVEALIERANQNHEVCNSPIERLRHTAYGYIEWACENPAYHQILRNPDVMRHSDERLKERLNENIRLQKEALSAAQKTGWRKESSLDALMMEFAAFLAGWALIATDRTYALVFDQTNIRQAGFGAVDRLLDC